MSKGTAHDSCPKENPDMTNATPAAPVAGTMPSTATPTQKVEQAAKADPAIIKAGPPAKV